MENPKSPILPNHIGRTTRMIQRAIQLAKDNIAYEREEKIYVIGENFAHAHELKKTMERLSGSLFLGNIIFISIAQLRRLVGITSAILIFDHFAVESMKPEHFECVDRLRASGRVLIDQTGIEDQIF
jgi:hypothetical protein